MDLRSALEAINGFAGRAALPRATSRASVFVLAVALAVLAIAATAGGGS